MKNLIYIISIILLSTTPGLSELLMTRDEALKTAFPGDVAVQKFNVILNQDQFNKIEKISKSKLNSKIYIFYKFTNGNETLGFAVLDTHLLRTKSETVMYLIGTDGRLIRAEILAFFEPPEYLQSEKWLRLFENKNLDNDHIRIDRDIPNITGATITSHEFTESVRKVLAIYNVAVKEGTT